MTPSPDRASKTQQGSANVSGAGAGPNAYRGEPVRVLHGGESPVSTPRGKGGKACVPPHSLPHANFLI